MCNFVAATSIFNDNLQPFSQKLREICKGRKPLFVCIGKSGVVYESVAPRIGTMLSVLPLFVFGSDRYNVTNSNLDATLSFIDRLCGDDYCKIAINCAIGAPEKTGSIFLFDGGINSGNFGGFFGKENAAFSRQTSFESLCDVGILIFTAIKNQNYRWNTPAAARYMQNLMANRLAQAIFCAFV